MSCLLSEFIFFQLPPKKNHIAFGSVDFFFFLLHLKHGYALTVFVVGFVVCHAQLEVFSTCIVELSYLTSCV